MWTVFWHKQYLKHYNVLLFAKKIEMVTKWYSFFLAIHYVALSSRHDYGLFENFEIMKDTFLKEKTSTLRLKSLRKELHNGITKMSYRDFLNWNAYVQIRLPLFYKATHSVNRGFNNCAAFVVELLVHAQRNSKLVSLPVPVYK